MKRYLGTVLCLVLLFEVTPVISAEHLDVSAASYVLMEEESGRVLFEKNSHQRLPIASITKLMTALVAVESGQTPDQLITVRPEWTGVEGSSIYLQPGEQLTFEALLYGMLLRSGNDAATAVAGCCYPETADFISAMNHKAAALGMGDSHFENPSGLNAPKHYSSAYDMALLAQACLRNPVISKMVKTRSVRFGERSFTNHNKLLWRCPGCIGLKTGYTKLAGRTLVSAARRDDMTLICVTLNAPDDWADHIKLYELGFSKFQKKLLATAGAPQGQIPVTGSLLPFAAVASGTSVSYPVRSHETVQCQTHFSSQLLRAPIRKGAYVGQLIYSLNGTKIASVPLVTDTSVPANLIKKNSFFSFWMPE